MSEPTSQPGPRRVHCAKLGRELPGLLQPPFANELGRRIYDHISQEAWRMWLEQSRMLINEYRLNLSNEESRRFLIAQCEAFLFGTGAAPPPEYEPPKTS